MSHREAVHNDYVTPVKYERQLPQLKPLAFVVSFAGVKSFRSPFSANSPRTISSRSRFPERFAIRRI